MAKPTVALDAMGGDHAPKEIVAGALLAARMHNATILLVGPKDLLKAEVESFGHSVVPSSAPAAAKRSEGKAAPEHAYSVELSAGGGEDSDGEDRRSSQKSAEGNILIIDAPDTIGMSDKAVHSIRSKPKSSIAVATRLVKDGFAGGIVSAGNTGAVASAATLIMGRIPGVPRPAIAVPIPAREHPVVLLDAGANADCRPKHLLSFGILGAVYCEEILELKKPRVGILSIGEERGKGNELVQRSAKLLEHSRLNFIGNVEGRDIPHGNAEVVVTDGFTGNVALKTLEGAASMIVSALRDELLSNWVSKSATLLLKKQLKAFRDRMNPEQYGGAHLLGVKGICIITHGSSSRTAIARSLEVAVHAIEKDLVHKLSKGLELDKKSIHEADAEEEAAGGDIDEPADISPGLLKGNVQ